MLDNAFESINYSFEIINFDSINDSSDLRKRLSEVKDDFFRLSGSISSFKKIFSDLEDSELERLFSTINFYESSLSEISSAVDFDFLRSFVENFFKELSDEEKIFYLKKNENFRFLILIVLLSVFENRQWISIVKQNLSLKVLNELLKDLDEKLSMNSSLKEEFSSLLELSNQLKKKNFHLIFFEIKPDFKKLKFDLIRKLKKEKTYEIELENEIESIQISLFELLELSKKRIMFRIQSDEKKERNLTLIITEPAVQSAAEFEKILFLIKKVFDQKKRAFNHLMVSFSYFDDEKKKPIKNMSKSLKFDFSTDKAFEASLFEEGILLPQLIGKENLSDAIEEAASIFETEDEKLKFRLKAVLNFISNLKPDDQFSAPLSLFKDLDQKLSKKDFKFFLERILSDSLKRFSEAEKRKILSFSARAYRYFFKNFKEVISDLDEKRISISEYRSLFVEELDIADSRAISKLNEFFFLLRKKDILFRLKATINDSIIDLYCLNLLLNDDEKKKFFSRSERKILKYAAKRFEEKFQELSLSIAQSLLSLLKSDSKRRSLLI